MKCTHRYVFALDVQMSVLQLSAKVCAPTRFFFNGKRRKHDSVLSTKNIIP